MGTTTPHRLALVPLLIALSGLACSRQATTPLTFHPSSTTSAALAPALTDAAALGRADGLVDLSLHRTTRTEGTQRVRTTLTDQAPGEWQEFPLTVEREVVGTETPVPGGSAYVSERVTTVSGGDTNETFDLWRQDRSGLFLYQEDVSGAIPQSVRAAAGAGLDAPQAAAFERAFAQLEAKRAALLGSVGASEPALQRAGTRAAGVGPNEITFLLYPLRPGASWEGRVGFNVWTVEALEPLVTPAGRFSSARLRVELPGVFGPDDSAHFWWGIPGQLRFVFRAVGDAVDESGNVVGRVEFEESSLLTSYASGSTS